MKITVLLGLFAIFHSIYAEDDALCEIEGIEYWYSMDTFRLENSINDTYSGIITTFKTRNIQELSRQSSEYLEAKLLDNTLTILTNDKFNKYEENFNREHSISLELQFKCTGNGSKTIIFMQFVEDTNNHEPIFNKNVYEYNFGMDIPEDYDLTAFLPIVAKDIDITNTAMYFTIDYNEYFTIGYHGSDNTYTRTNFVTNLKALQKITSPFKKEFTIVAKDAGTPSRNATARVIISVTSKTTTILHPPIFSEHLYFADYTIDHKLKMEKPIAFKYGFQNDTIVEQSAFEEYFKITRDPNIKDSLMVQLLEPVPKSVIETTDLLVIEIKAENEGLSNMPGRTAIVIRLPHSSNLDVNAQENSQPCSVQISGLPGYSSLPLILLLSAISMVVVMNVIVFFWYIQKQKATQIVNPIFANPNIFNNEKMYKI